MPESDPVLVVNREKGHSQVRSRVGGSVGRGKLRTSLRFAILTSTIGAARRASPVASRFDDDTHSQCFGPLTTRVGSRGLYRNPIVIAREWKGMLATKEYPSQADLAR